MNITVNMGEYDEQPTVEQVLVDLSFWISTEGPEVVARFAEIEE